MMRFVSNTRHLPVECWVSLLQEPVTSGGNWVPLEPFNLNYPSIGVSQVPGSKTVTRTVTNIASVQSIYGKRCCTPGYTVTVSPKNPHFEQRTSATFSVTITMSALRSVKALWLI